MRLYLTPEAQPLLDKMWERAAQTHEDAQADLTAAEREQFIKTLQQMKQSLLATEERLGREDLELEERIANAAVRS